MPKRVEILAVIDTTPAWKPVVEAVHAEGAPIFLQFWHCGRASHSDFHGGELPVAPSAIKSGGEPALDRLADHRVQAVCLATGSGAFRSLERTLMGAGAWSLAAADGGGILLVPGSGVGDQEPADVLAAAARRGFYIARAPVLMEK